MSAGPRSATLKTPPIPSKIAVEPLDLIFRVSGVSVEAVMAETHSVLLPSILRALPERASVTDRLSVMNCLYKASSKVVPVADKGNHPTGRKTFLVIISVFVPREAAPLFSQALRVPLGSSTKIDVLVESHGSLTVEARWPDHEFHQPVIISGPIPSSLDPSLLQSILNSAPDEAKKSLRLNGEFREVKAIETQVSVPFLTDVDMGQSSAEKIVYLPTPTLQHRTLCVPSSDRLSATLILKNHREKVPYKYGAPIITLEIPESDAADAPITIVKLCVRAKEDSTIPVWRTTTAIQPFPIAKIPTPPPLPGPIPKKESSGPERKKPSKAQGPGPAGQASKSKPEARVSKDPGPPPTSVKSATPPVVVGGKTVSNPPPSPLPLKNTYAALATDAGAEHTDPGDGGEMV